MASTPTLTTAAFERSHTRKPRGRGLWLLAETTGRTAFAAELTGRTFEHSGTLTEARKALAATGATGTWAVMP